MKPYIWCDVNDYHRHTVYNKNNYFIIQNNGIIIYKTRERISNFFSKKLIRFT